MSYHKDKNRNNNEIGNIALLCKKCHEVEHGKRNNEGNPTVKLARIGSSLRLTVPKDVIRTLSWKEGDILEIGLTDNMMTVKKAKK